MKEKQIIDTSYIIGTALLQMNKVSYSQIELIKEQLLNNNENYIINIGVDNTMASIDEWRDFFMTNEDNEILLTDNSIRTRNTVLLLFNSVLPLSIQLDLLKSINEVKCKKYIKLVK